MLCNANCDTADEPFGGSTSQARVPIIFVDHLSGILAGDMFAIAVFKDSKHKYVTGHLDGCSDDSVLHVRVLNPSHTMCSNPKELQSPPSRTRAHSFCPFVKAAQPCCRH